MSTSIPTENPVSTETSQTLSPTVDPVPVPNLNTNLIKVMIDTDDSVMFVYKGSDNNFVLKNLDQIRETIGPTAFGKLFVSRNSVPNVQVINNLYTKNTDPTKICELAPKNGMSGWVRLTAQVANLTNMNACGIIKTEYFVKYIKDTITVKQTKFKVVMTDGDMGDFGFKHSVAADNKIQLNVIGSSKAVLNWTVTVTYSQTDFLVQ